MEEERRSLRRLYALQQAYIQNSMEMPKALEDTRMHDEQLFKPVTVWTLHKNEWLDLEEKEEDKPPYTP